MLNARAGLVSFGIALAAGAPPALAQPAWLQNLLSGGTEQPAARPSAPASHKPVAAVLPPQAVVLAPQAAVLPPRRPAAFGTPSAAASGLVMTVATAAPPPAPAAPPAPLTERQVIDKANAYFNGISTLVGDFIQVGGDGRSLGGTLYLQRPGKLRFAYEAPATLEIVADGRSVAVRDRKLSTQDLYLISQTPLKFLLRDNIDLARDTTITEVASDAEGVRIALEDKATLGGTSRITLHFDRNVGALSRWRVVDPQGFQTTVTLSNLDRSRKIDPQLFVINEERMLGESSNR